MNHNAVSMLLVEDNPDDIAYVTEVLKQKNSHYKLLTARTLSDAVCQIKKNTLDVILLDLCLPDERGCPTFRRLRQEVPNMPIIVFSQLNDEDTVLECMREGAEDFIVKGEYDHDFLFRTIRYALERHRIRKELQSVTEELKIVNLKLERLAVVDPLTDVLNRRGLQQILTRELDVLKREGSGLLVLVVDLDDFDRINQSLGHVTGDIILKETARRLRSSLRPSDYIARIGGDEFVILLPQTRFAEGIHVAEKLRLAISQNSVSVNGGSGVYITASLALGGVSHDTPTIDHILSKTHLILNQSKMSGKNRVAYEGDLTSEPVTFGGNLTAVRAALQSGEAFHALRQPIVDLRTQQNVAYEFLSRSRVSGFEMPDDFFRFSMETNILNLVDHHCFQACVRASRSGFDMARAHINLFPSTMIDTPVQDLIMGMEGNGGDYCIEISEQQIIGDPSYLADPVLQLKREGIKIAIDDVGFGRSCLESLVLLEPEIVKIDKKWVLGIKYDATRRRSLSRLLKVTHSLGCEVVAEGIETRDELEVLQDFNVHYGQGYFFGKPS